MVRRFAARAASLRPADFLRRLVLVGLLLAIVVAGVIAALETFKISRECGGAFSQGFSAGFDRSHCQLVMRASRGSHQIKIPLS
jgi:hypothetical protein